MNSDPQKVEASPENGYCNGVQTSLENLRTVPKRIKYFSTEFPNQEAFVFYTSTSRFAFTWKQLYDLASRFAWRLHNQGFCRYDVIANTLPNSPERLITDLGIMFAGCTPLNGQILMADGEDFFLSVRVSRCKAVVMCPHQQHTAWKLLGSKVFGDTSGLFGAMSCDKAPELTSAILVSRDVFNVGIPVIEEINKDNCSIFVADLDPYDVLTVFATSGSTGYSKLVARTHDWLTSMFASTNVRFTDLQLYATQTTFSDRPIGWIGGYPLTTYGQGEKRVLLDSLCENLNSTQKASLCWSAICKENCQQVSLTPHEFNDIYNYVESIGGSDFKPKMVGTGGQPIRTYQVEKMLKLFKSVFIAYGSTEAGLISGALLTDAKRDDFFCGKPVVKENFKLVNKDNEHCKPREIGRIWVKGNQVFTGYFNKTEETRQQENCIFSSDGWFNTEDNGYLDEQGDLYVVGRQKSAITYGAHAVYPEWLERKLVAHPDIEEAVVVPVSDPDLFENICACVQPLPNKTLTTENLQEFAQKMFLTNSESDVTPIPKFFMVIDEMPQTASGKQNRQLIQKMAEKKFGHKAF